MCESSVWTRRPEFFACLRSVPLLSIFDMVMSATYLLQTWAEATLTTSCCGSSQLVWPRGCWHQRPAAATTWPAPVTMSWRTSLR